MSEKQERRKVYDFDAMGDEVDRPIGIINSKEYEMYPSMNEMGPQRIAQVSRLDTRLKAAKEDENLEEMLSVLSDIIPLIFVDTISDEEVSEISLNKLRHIYESFGSRLRGRGSGAAEGDGSDQGEGNRTRLEDIDWGMLAARCQRFYGAGDPAVWLRMPLGHLAFFVAEIPGLRAEESLTRVMELRIAFAPAGEGGDEIRMVESGWREKARRDERIFALEDTPKMTKEEYDAMLRLTGVKRREWVVDEDNG